ncbi:uncharacterized protein LOC132745306 [Ruditapes philippinarum]|uniref:uncharacterized protein LOC132745306 n=1 Tax=Ruditapes philippinarum TaxID=129788 RepID=UPI00295AAC5D|nr:uncharacterized protein LOC132745306 [Ruditapes philippinarum]
MSNQGVVRSISNRPTEHKCVHIRPKVQDNGTTPEIQTKDTQCGPDNVEPIDKNFQFPENQEVLDEYRLNIEDDFVDDVDDDPDWEPSEEDFVDMDDDDEDDENSSVW